MLLEIEDIYSDPRESTPGRGQLVVQGICQGGRGEAEMENMALAKTNGTQKANWKEQDPHPLPQPSRLFQKQRATEGTQSPKGNRKL